MIRLSTEHEWLPDASAFADVLGPGLAAKRNGRVVKFEAARLPPLRVKNGRITACDGVILEGPPFARSVPNGEHDVTLGIATIGREERIAFAQVRFAPDPAVRWATAAMEGSEAGTSNGYPVDYATGCFADPAALRQVVEADMADQMTDAAEEVYSPNRRWLSVRAASGSIAIFSTGFGDGSYVSTFGLAAGGVPVVLLTDFAVVDWPSRPKP